MIRKTIFRTVATAVKTIATGRKMGSTPNTAKTAGDLQSMSRVKESMDGKVGGDIKGRGILAKLT